jgi:hypothetical protein
MITKEIQLEKTGYYCFLNFKRNGQRSANSHTLSGLTKYLYDKNKTVELDLRPEELFMAANAEAVKKKAREKKTAAKINEVTAFLFSECQRTK